MEILGYIIGAIALYVLCRGGMEMNYHANVARRARVHTKTRHEEIQREQANG